MASSGFLLTILLTVHSSVLQKPPQHEAFKSEARVGIAHWTVDLGELLEFGELHPDLSLLFSAFGHWLADSFADTCFVFWKKANSDMKTVVEKNRKLIERLLTEVSNSNGTAAVDRYFSLRDVDAKVRELRLLLQSLPESAASLKKEFDGDLDFGANSRRVRLEAVANYCRTALKFLDSGLIEKAKPITQAPDLSKLTGSNLALRKIMEDRLG